MNIAVDTLTCAPPSRPLSELRTGDSAMIVDIDLRCGVGRRLMALGFVPGSVVTVRRCAPLRDPVEYCVRGTCVSLRRSEAASIRVATGS